MENLKFTPHINPTGPIAPRVILPGDPLRAKYIAENFLTDVAQFNSVRNALGFTGEYKGVPVSVMGTGMGMPSIGIYAHELVSVYGVNRLIRAGSCGAFQDNMKLYDIVIGIAASTNSNFAAQYGLPGVFAPCCSYKLLEAAVSCAKALGLPVHIGNILSSDVFYNDDKKSNDAWKKMGLLAVEMEAAALYMIAARLGVEALCVLTVSDHLYSGEETSSAEREKSFGDMVRVVLETAIG